MADSNRIRTCRVSASFVLIVLPCSAIVDLIEGLAAILLVEGPARRPRSHGGIIFGRWQASKESARATIDADRDRYMALDSPAIS